MDLNVLAAHIKRIGCCRSPQGERGFKYLFDGAAFFKQIVAPRRGSVDLNNFQLERLGINQNVAPRRGSVDLNASQFARFADEMRRSPQGERGFKCRTLSSEAAANDVAPRRGSVDLNAPQSPG